MDWRDLLAAFIGRGRAAEPVAAQEPPPARRRRDFIVDLGGETVAAHYDRLAADRAAAAADGLDIDYIEDGNDYLFDVILEHVLVKHHLAVDVDWVGDPDAFVDGFNAQLARRGAPVLDDAQRQYVFDYADSKPVYRGDYIGHMFGPMAEHADKAGLKILDIKDGSDCYHFVVATPDIYDRWAGVKLSRTTEVQDPSWQFKDQLPGSPYERFYRV